MTPDYKASSFTFTTRRLLRGDVSGCAIMRESQGWTDFLYPHRFESYYPFSLSPTGQLDTLDVNDCLVYHRKFPAYVLPHAFADKAALEKAPQQCYFEYEEKCTHGRLL